MHDERDDIELVAYVSGKQEEMNHREPLLPKTLYRFGGGAYFGYPLPVPDQPTGRP